MSNTKSILHLRFQNLLMLNKLLPLFLLSFVASFSQEIEYSASATLQGLISSEEKNPFWLHSNTRGRIGEETNIAGWITGTGKFSFRNDSFLELGLGGFYHDGFTNEIDLDAYYISFQNNWMLAYAGRKQKKEYYRGLSATNESILWSLNSRPIPGISFEITEPVYFWKQAGLGFMLSWEELFSDERDRYIENLRVHHKSFHLVYSGIRNVQLIAGVQHYVQWGGKSPEQGDLPSGFDDYLRVITGGSIIGGDGLIGDNEINGLGNHLGGYEAQLNTSMSHFDVSLIYNTIFEDMSGIKLRNTPDGRYSIYIEDREENKWIEAFMYEYYFTRNQSKNYPTTDGKDNYFNNHLYKSGWTYDHQVIGLPFFVIRDNLLGIAHNNIVAHHIGITGDAFYEYPYKLLASYRANYGAKGGTSKPIERIFSTLVDVEVWQQVVRVNLQIGADINLGANNTEADINSEKSVNMGVGVRVYKKIF